MNPVATVVRDAKSCPVHAIDEKDVSRTRISECIECGICVELKESCSSFALSKLFIPEKPPP